jgi:hypothetical protein
VAQQYQLPDGRIVEATPDGKYRVVSGGPSAITGGDPKLPGALTGQQLGNAGQALQNQRTAAELQTIPLQRENTRANIAQAQTQIANTKLDNLNNLRKQFEALQSVQDYRTVLPQMASAINAKDNKAGDLNLIYAFGKIMDPNSVVREGELGMAQDVGGVAERVRGYINALNGQGRLTQQQRKELLGEIHTRSSALADAYNQQREYYRTVASHEGLTPEDVVGPHPGVPFQQAEADFLGRPVRNANGTLGPAPHGQMPPPAFAPPPTGADPSAGQSTDGFSDKGDPQSAAYWEGAARSGAPYSAALQGWQQQTSQRGLQTVTPPPENAYNRVRTYLKQHPSTEYHPFNSVIRTPMNDRQINANAFANSGPGALVAGLARGIPFSDEAVGAAGSAVGGDYNQIRDDFRAKGDLIAQDNPSMEALGEAASGVPIGYGMAKGLSKVPFLRGGLFGAKTPFPNLLAREALAGDALYGGAYGAGADNEDRLRGLGLGAGVGLAGGLAARGAIGSAASAISPTGGKLAPLYAMGVRPSIGQRLGGMANAFEEKLQSVPFVGDAIKGTRDRARDQFQIGLFNDALGEIGQKLPDNMTVGHEPHAFAQNAFNTAYDSAQGGMTAAKDSQLISDVVDLQKMVGTLRPESQQMFDKVWSGSVERRAAQGSLSGNSYKQAVSELGKKAAALRGNPTGDSELADAFDAASNALKSSAMRNSHPDAVAAMNAADRGYAKLVRLEEASRKPGGEPAEFSPSQYNTAVKSASGGTRNRSYLRGDALNADIAALGTRLGDKVSNSGTVDRLLAGMAVGGAGYVEPTTATVLGGLGAINAPGIRNVTTGLMAPRNSAVLEGAADQLRRRARMAGMFGAPVALDLYGP